MGIGVDQKLRRFPLEMLMASIYYSDVWENKRSRNSRTKANFENSFLFLVDVTFFGCARFSPTSSEAENDYITFSTWYVVSASSHKYAF